MSDQPKPTGEWTVETLREFVKNYGWQIAVSQLNAALAAERECAWCESERYEVLQQLAAERERFNKQEQQWLGENLKLTDQFDAEREKVQQLEKRLAQYEH